MLMCELLLMLEFVGSSEVGIEVGILGWEMGEDVGISIRMGI